MKTRGEIHEEAVGNWRVEYPILENRFRFVQGLRFIVLGGLLAFEITLARALYSTVVTIRSAKFGGLDVMLLAAMPVLGIALAIFAIIIDRLFDDTLRHTVKRGNFIERKLELDLREPGDQIEPTFSFLVSKKQFGAWFFDQLSGRSPLTWIISVGYLGAVLAWIIVACRYWPMARRWIFA